MANIITLDVANAGEDAFTLPARITDPINYPAAISEVVTAEFVGKPLYENVKALLNGRVSSMQYMQTYTCISGLNVGDPVYISAASTATLALATTVATSRVIGFVRYKPTTTTCLLEHFLYVTGMSAATVGDPIYLTDAGGYSGTAGTVPVIIGRFLTTTTGLVAAIPGQQFAGDASVVSGTFALTGDISPTTLVANTDNYNPTGLSTAAVIRLSSTGGPFNITGIAGGSDGRILILINLASTFFTLKNETTSTAANRFVCPLFADYILQPGASVVLIYDSTNSRWRMLDGSTGIAGYTAETTIADGDELLINDVSEVAINKITRANFLGSLLATFTSNIQSPVVIGGTGTGSTLILESTSGAGATDAIIFKTASQVEAFRILTSGDISFATTAGNGIVGVIDASNATAGNVGEAVRSAVDYSVSPSTTNQFKTITSISLTAGDWDISGIVIFTPGTATLTTLFAQAAISENADNTTTDQVRGDNQVPFYTGTTSNDETSAAIPTFRVTTSTTKTYYLKGRVGYSAGTSLFGGRISARRVR